MRGLALALVGGVTFALGSPPTDLYPCLLLGLALLAASLDDAPSAWRGFGRGVAWAAVAGLVGLRFVPAVIVRFTPLGPLPAGLALGLLSAAQALVWGVGSALAVALKRRLHAPLELALAAGVFMALALPTIFAWSPAGLASPWPAFVQLADVVGERGVSALFAVVAALVARSGLRAMSQPATTCPKIPEQAHHGDTETRRIPCSSPCLRASVVNSGQLFAAAVAILAVLWAHGTLRMRAVDREGEALPTVKLGLVDASIGPHERWDPRNHVAILRSLRAESARSEAQGAELTVWPEAAYPFPVRRDAHRMPPRGPRAPLADGVHGPLLMGLITEAPPVWVSPTLTERVSWNSAALVLPDGSLSAPYDKLQLLWFGETVPGGQLFPWLRRTFQRGGGLVAGTEPRALELARETGPALRMAVLNCYEDTLPSVGRRLARALRPNLLVNVTNDAWFFSTAEPELHGRLAVLRAIELRRDLVRAVNMGVTSWVSASGRIRAHRDDATPGVLMATPALRSDDATLYARFGDVPVALLLALGCAESLRRSRHRAPR